MVTPWIYKGKVVSDKTPPKELYGFVYILTLKDKTKYIGKKSFWSQKKKNLTLKEISEMDNKRLKKWKYVISETKWRNYTSSSKVFGSKDVETKEIICMARSKRELTYLETKNLFLNNAIEADDFHNVNIMNRFFRDNLV